MMGKSYEERLALRPAPSAPASRHDNQHYKHDDLDFENMGEIEELPREGTETVVYPALIDPLVQDLSPNSRYYLYHFATQICEDLVVHDGPNQNPIRDLLPATAAYPALLHIILANSAFHVFNISRDPLTQSPYQQTQRRYLVAQYQAMSRYGGPMKSSYADALLAKQQALSFLAQSVLSVNETNIDLVLVVILLFINYDLIESGRDKWKVHMNGARQLIELLGTPPYLQQPMSRLRLSVLADFLVFFVLGSTFTFSVMRTSIPDPVDLDSVLRYAETNNYLSCPSPLLRIMLDSFKLEDTRQWLSDHIDIEVQDRVGVLLKAALKFDPVEWSLTFQPASPSENLEHRMHIAAAHRAAVCIYLTRGFPYSNPLLDPSSGSALISLTGLANEIISHISYLKPGDTLFKSISWPLFLAGAECEDPAGRDWIMNSLDELYNQMYWGYLHTAKKGLETIWRCKDKKAAGVDNCWIYDLKDLGHEILIA